MWKFFVEHLRKNSVTANYTKIAQICEIKGDLCTRQQCKEALRDDMQDGENSSLVNRNDKHYLSKVEFALDTVVVSSTLTAEQTRDKTWVAERIRKGTRNTRSSTKKLGKEVLKTAIIEQIGCCNIIYTLMQNLQYIVRDKTLRMKDIIDVPFGIILPWAEATIAKN